MDNLEQRKIFARNLKRWMFLKDKTQNDLINDLGLPSSTISQWATAKKYPRIDKVQMLADYFGILKSDLIEDKSNAITDPEKILSKQSMDMTKAFGNNPKEIAEYIIKCYDEKEKKENPSNTQLFNPLQVYPINILGKISAGLPLEAQEDFTGQTFITYNDYQNYFALQVSGDSMNNIIQDKSIVIVRKQENLENGEIGVIMVNGYDATVKRYKRQGDTIILIPESSNKDHMPQIYNINETEIKILGKVVEFCTKL